MTEEEAARRSMVWEDPDIQPRAGLLGPVVFGFVLGIIVATIVNWVTPP